MNPGKIVDARGITHDLRLGPQYDPQQPETHFHYPDDQGSLARAALRCAGVGKCRRLSSEHAEPDDVMCTSYMVTREEEHSTRGRAHLLWEMLRGGDSPIRDGFRNKHVKDALELCLACKGCKGECPVNVDVATYKAEFLAHHYRGRLRPRQAYAFGFIDKWARIAAHMPRLLNFLTHFWLTAWLAKIVAGMDRSREVPRFATETFVHWFSRRKTKLVAAKRVVLWPDTFNNHFHPDTARAAVQVLESAGYEVLVPSAAVCCGRPLYDYGFLGQARVYLERVLEIVSPWVNDGLSIVVLEPSCASVFRDELPNLMPARVEAQRLAKQTKLLSEFLVEEGVELPKLRRHAIVQGHCHHKSLLGWDAQDKVHHAMELDAPLLSSGCCGMAGAFGFERDEAKQKVSRALGERVLFGEVRKASRDTLILADGFSCRTQIEQGTGQHALHLAEVLALAYRENGQVGAEEASGRPQKRGFVAALGALFSRLLDAAFNVPEPFVRARLPSSSHTHEESSSEARS
jgi:Fe-S oxidoreductase